MARNVGESNRQTDKIHINLGQDGSSEREAGTHCTGCQEQLYLCPRTSLRVLKRLPAPTLAASQGGTSDTSTLEAESQNPGPAGQPASPYQETPRPMRGLVWKIKVDPWPWPRASTLMRAHTHTGIHSHTSKRYYEVPVLFISFQQQRQVKELKEEA